ncbi:PspC domain-containing protein [Faecalibacter rhinopitheci]|uniref:PspC domain-containing protein n=1 Tax=Faecalibacter rhinopitheci TaxID=2779678 RepID=A0A8J7FPB4_9FLAO|nr:PspC domain-containing protein [Faecalibacter rhinopitheci]MBF0598207.1 PspC domain-containing protein [Faecalibacter rhinopitheci]
MDKTVSISLGGFSFVVEEIAYSKLRTYLQDVKNSLHGTEGIDDIIEDVEIRISELFRDRLKFREVVSDDDVNFVIATMGHPNQYRVEDEEAESTSTHSTYTQSSFETKNNKRLFRDPDDKIITGLSAGLAHYLGLDPWAVRATWLVLGILGIFTGISFFLVVLCYFILLIFVPKATTTSEKLQMYGKPANIESFKKNAEVASEAVISGSRELSNKLGGVFGAFGKFLLWFVGFIITSIGVGLIIGGCALAFTTWTDIPTELFGYMVEDQWMSVATKILGGILMIIPGILITILGVRCFTRVKTSKALIIASIVIWFIALFAIIGISLNTASRFRSDVEFVKDETLTVSSDTLIVQFKDQNLGGYNFKVMNDLDQLIDEEGNLIIPIDDEITLGESDTNQFKISLKYKAKGGSTAEAKRNVESTIYNHILEGNVLNLDEFIKIKKEGKFRKQDVEIKIFVPKNKVVNVKKMNNLSLIDNGVEKYFYSPNNKFFLNNGEKIVCLNCNSEELENDEISDREFQINVNDADENAKVRIDKNGIRIESKDGSIGISTPTKQQNNNQINYKDDTDSININYRNN